MINKIHILGASGSGTSTLAKALSEKLGYKHFDTDDYYWIPTDEPFTKVRQIQDRQSLLQKDLTNTPQWILSGSLCGWGDMFVPYFDLVVFIWIPKEIRIKRLIEREQNRYGKEIETNGSRYQSFKEFIEWAASYDEADVETRSRAMHEQWISELKCPVIRIEGDITSSVQERVSKVLEMINTARA
ncbi:Adenylate kinase [Paenibacillus sophorae]|uniref:AAA family ATPase n=1 Tax=Paenibacillus sophorae TaxID=1333845 RepID=A0A1H8Q0S5_9BACL|nr:AAA family ATPase [Paenibacillus sophorae]QWU15318.1 AAA family ATPase [Paenibacillus sophorae]SEO47676.1 Adenylate kinase [Paenibacillus sophorae]